MSPREPPSPLPTISLCDGAFIYIDDPLSLVHTIDIVSCCILPFELARITVMVNGHWPDDLIAHTQLVLQIPPDHHCINVELCLRLKVSLDGSSSNQLRGFFNELTYHPLRPGVQLLKGLFLLMLTYLLVPML